MKTKSAPHGDVGNSTEMIESIRDINGDPFDPIWAAEFRGFFWGEGTLATRPNKPIRPSDGWSSPNGYSYTIHASIGLRDDDRKVLEEFQRRLGGTLRQEKYIKDPNKFITRWQVSVAKDLDRIGRLLEDGSLIPFNKKRQLQLWREAIAIKLKNGAMIRSRYSLEESVRMFEIAREIRILKDYNPDW